MATKRWATTTAVALGIAFSAVGCAPATIPEVRMVQSQQEETREISASSEIAIPFTKSEVSTIPAPIAAPVKKAAEAPVTKAEVAEPKAEAPVVAREVPKPAAPAPVLAPAPAVAARKVEAPPAPVNRSVYVGLSGGQSVVDLERGPVLFPIPAGFPPYVVEHDITGGWARFGSLRSGMTVRMSGLVTGTYTVGQIITVPKYGTTDEFSKFAVMPKVLLQTCIPGTNKMVVVGLY